jgi:uncharacterized membrane protein (UPF0127 family)
MRFDESAILHTANGPQALRVQTARGFWGRFRGLMLARHLSAAPITQALLIPRCPSVHGFFMRYALDIVYLSSDPANPHSNPGAGSYQVTHTAHLKPWRVSMGKRWRPNGPAGTAPLRSEHALELPAGSIALLGIALGDRLEVGC